ncbi:MAG: nucleotidyltransferase domain-containing protein [Ruminiclostridium sp.]|nr:nucleotidyltransferase domain-containing protein [Ruminiclostridium sp.]
MAIGLEEKIVKNLVDALSKYREVKRAVIFGSRAQGNYKYNSDIDLAVYCDENFPSELYNELDIAAGIYKIDVIDVGILHNNNLLKSIERKGIVLYNQY